MKNLKVQEIFQFLSEWAPLSLAEDWDPVGLQVGSLKSEVKGILVALDVTNAVLQEANKKKCNLLITHHPLMGQKEKGSIAERLAQKARKQKINILSFHTNLDSTSEGLNDLLAQQLKLKSLKPLLKSRSKKHPLSGIGRIGLIRPMTLKQFLCHVARCTNLKNFRYVGELQQKIKKVAVVTGSGAGYFLEAKKKGADVLVTGDVKYHGALDALSEGVCLIDIGHFESEIGMIDCLLSKLKKASFLKELAIPLYPCRIQRDPLKFWSS